MSQGPLRELSSIYAHLSSLPLVNDHFSTALVICRMHLSSNDLNTNFVDVSDVSPKKLYFVIFGAKS